MDGRTTPQRRLSSRVIAAAVVSALAVVGLATVALRPDPGESADLATIDAVDPTTTTTTRPTPVPTTIPAPPNLLVTTGGATTPVSGYDYCWTPAGAAQGMCADSFGQQIPVPITVEGPTLTLQWATNSELGAGVRNEGERCGRPLLVEKIGPGQWELTVPPEAGEYDVYLTGSAPEGRVQFALALTTTVNGPSPRPHAHVSWGAVDDPLSLSFDLIGSAPVTEAAVTIRSMDDIVTTLSIPLAVPPEDPCGRTQGWTMIDEPSTLGRRPLVIEVEILDGTQRYGLTDTWSVDPMDWVDFDGFMDPLD